MQIRLGEKIRELRKRDGRTQEALADALGVTGQAVSRWEANGGYPDMEIIPAIANYFNVTIDELFGHSLDEKQKRYDELYAEYDRLARRWENPDILIPYLRNALAEFPGDEQLRISLAKQLYYKFNTPVHGRTDPETGIWTPIYEKMREKEGWEEAEKIMLQLLETTRSKDIREECDQLLFFIYTYIGEIDKAKAIAEQLNSICCCKDEMLESLYGEEGERQKQNNIIFYATWLRHKINYLPLEDRIAPEKRIALLETYIAFLETLFEDTFGFHTDDMCWLHMQLAELFAKQTDTGKTLYHLRKSCEYALKFDEYLNKGEKIRYTSPFLRLADDCDPKEWTATEQAPHVKEYLENGKIFDPLRPLPEFTELIRMLDE